MKKKNTNYHNIFIYNKFIIITIIIKNYETKKSIYSVMEDDIKDRDYEIEYTWICDESNKKHTEVPSDLVEEAEKKAKVNFYYIYLNDNK